MNIYEVISCDDRLSDARDALFLYPEEVLRSHDVYDDIYEWQLG